MTLAGELDENRHAAYVNCLDDMIESNDERHHYPTPHFCSSRGPEYVILPPPEDLYMHKERFRV